MRVRFSKTLRLAAASILILAAINAVVFLGKFVPAKIPGTKNNTSAAAGHEPITWQAPDTSQIPFTSEGNLIRYGRDLIANTSFYLGPKGKIATITNGMNCQNCHLDAGTRLWGNNYSAVFSTYPRFRERSGTVENIHKRVNDCIERSLNGKKLDTNSREMLAISAYINWVGHNVPKNVKPKGAGIRDIPLLNRAANRAKGLFVYQQKCQRCHGSKGEGLFKRDSTAYVYPPLWGKNSYNTGAGLFRISRFAGYVKENMPFDTPRNPAGLTDEEAWDVAAFVNTQPRPQKKFTRDWPDISGKPFDHPFGPYADSFPEQQHKYGPFGPIRLAYEKSREENIKSH
jgi:thiosulfate dehydrogenase